MHTPKPKAKTKNPNELQFTSIIITMLDLFFFSSSFLPPEFVLKKAEVFFLVLSPVRLTHI